jgi:hypothetical protein
MSNHRAVKFLAPYARYPAYRYANFEPHPAQNASRTRGPIGAIGSSNIGKPTATVT